MFHTQKCKHIQKVGDIVDKVKNKEQQNERHSRNSASSIKVKKCLQRVIKHGLIYCMRWDAGTNLQSVASHNNMICHVAKWAQPQTSGCKWKIDSACNGFNHTECSSVSAGTQDWSSWLQRGEIRAVNPRDSDEELPGFCWWWWHQRSEY